MRSYLVSLLVPVLMLFVACGDPVTAPDPLVVACASFCSANISDCSGADAQFVNESSCNAFCSDFTQFPIGEVGASTGNSVECRKFHSAIARDSGQTAVHCPHTGYTGANTCGTWCENYCDLAAQNCPDIFAGDPACKLACGALDDAGNIDDMAGDTVQCRLSYLLLAGLEGDASATVECPKAQIMSDVCK